MDTTSSDATFPIVDTSGREVGNVVLPAGSVAHESEIIIAPGTPDAERAAERLPRASDVVEIDKPDKP